jgi:hypothetical protein
MRAPRRLPDPSPGDWVNERLMMVHGTQGIPVGAVVPTGFPRVVRVLHPAGDGRSWAQVAAVAGRTVHPLVQWAAIADHFDGTGRSSDVDPQEGSVPADTLAAILEHCPAETDVIHAVWGGFGSWVERSDERTLMPGWGGREYLLFDASKEPHTHWPGMDALWSQSANLIWPPDHSWCIATEIDWDSTLVAGPDSVADGILGDARLEAFEVAYEDDLSWYGDSVNPRPKWLP